jgi:hypothetical protein
MIGIVVWMLSFIAAIMYYRMSRRTVIVLQPFADLRAAHQHHEPDDQPPSLIELNCNPPHLIQAKAEVLPHSFMQDHGLSLKSVIIVIRHGDRGPLRPVKNLRSINFNPLQVNSKNKKSMVQESHLIDMFHSLNSSKKYKAAHENSLSFDLVPGPSGRLGQLSVMGSVQEIKLGLEMGKVYAKHLNPDSGLHTIRDTMSCVTRSFERTFQSAVSFLYGFLNHTNSDPDQMVQVIADNIIGSQGSFLCNTPSYSRDCNKVVALGKVWESIRDEAVAEHPALVQLLKKVSTILTPDQHDDDQKQVFVGASKDAFRNAIEKPNQAIDGLNAYVCHDAVLPCKDGECLTTDDMKRLLVFMNKILLKTTTDDAFHLLSLMKVRGFFDRLIQIFAEIADSSKKHKALTLLSAHDITLIPIAVSLGFWDATVPPYASRINFEVYHKRDSGGYYFRIIYNGKDVTKNSSICKDVTSSPCVSLEPVTPLEISDLERSSKTHPHHTTTFTLIPMQSLESFITKRFIDLANTDNFEEACSAV